MSDRVTIYHSGSYGLVDTVMFVFKVANVSNVPPMENAKTTETLSPWSYLILIRPAKHKEHS
jgi:hypothetical protein